MADLHCSGPKGKKVRLDPSQATAPEACFPMTCIFHIYSTSYGCQNLPQTVAASEHQVFKYVNLFGTLRQIITEG